MDEDKRARNREAMPAVAELVDAHIAAFGNDFTLIKCIDYGTHNRVTKKGHRPYPFPEELDAQLELLNKEIAAAAEDQY